MKVVEHRHHRALMDSQLPPVARVAPGERLVIETQDACYGRVRSLADFERYRDDPRRQTDPLIGPIYIEGARSGGTLVVDILAVDLDDTGFQLIGPNRAIVRDEVPDWTCYLVSIRDGKIRLPNGIELPIKPVIGTLGNAPAGGAKSCNQSNPLGGVLSCPEIGVGSRVYLPIDVEGAMFYLGDVHARQGDGEVVGAPEIGARVTVRFNVLEHSHAAWPMVEAGDYWYTITSGVTEEDAIRIGTFEAARFIQRNYGLSFNDALIVLTMCVKITSSRTCGWGPLERVICTGFSKSLLQAASANYVR